MKQLPVKYTHRPILHIPVDVVKAQKTAIQKRIEDKITAGMGYSRVRGAVGETLKAHDLLGTDRGADEGCVGGVGIRHNSPLGVESKLRAYEARK